MIPGNFFSKCIEIERLIGSLYAHFAQNENYDEARRAMWTKLSQDEEGHALDLELASRISLKNEQLSTTIPLGLLDDLFNHLNKIFSSIKHQTISDAVAVKLAVEIEVEAMVVHSRSSVGFHDDQLRNLFMSLGTYDGQHLSGLAEAYHHLHGHEPVTLTQGF